MSPATRLQPKPRNLRNGKYTHSSPEPASDSDSGPGADSDSGPGGDHHLGNKTGFPPRTWPYPHAMPSAAARKTQGARAHPPIPLDRPGGTPSVHSGRFPPLTGGCFLCGSSEGQVPIMGSRKMTSVAREQADGRRVIPHGHSRLRGQDTTCGCNGHGYHMRV